MHLVKGIRQIGFVVDDLDSAKQLYEREWGQLEWVHYEYSKEDFEDHPRYTHGKLIPVAAKIAKATVGNVELEFIKPMCNDSIYSEFMSKYGSGFHHLQLNVENFEDSFDYFKSQGYEVIQDGVSKRGVRIAYFDTYDAYGFYIEIAVYDYLK